MSESKTEAGSERHIPLSTAATSAVYGALGGTLYNRPYLDGGTLMSFDAIMGLDHKLTKQEAELKGTPFYDFAKNEIRYFRMAAEIIKEKPDVRAYFPPTFAGLTELGAVLHQIESQETTKNMLLETLKKPEHKPLFAVRGIDGKGLST